MQTVGLITSSSKQDAQCLPPDSDTLVNSGGFQSHCLQVIFPPYLLQLRLAKLHHPCTAVPYSVIRQYSGNCGGFPHVARSSERNSLWTRCEHSGQAAVTFGFTSITYGNTFAWEMLKGKKKSRIQHNKFIGTFLLLHRAFWNLPSSLINKCTIY